MPEKQTRKLAVVMFTDITGYDAMVQHSEAEALACVDIHRKALQKNAEEHGGQVITFYGNGSLSTYPSAIDAVNCALKMQEAYREHTIPVRIGLHLGDIVFRGDSVYGDGVNVASRVQTQGIAGSILISGKLQQEITNHPDIQTKSLGHYNLKNVKSLIELFAVTNPGLVVPTGHKRASTIKRILARGSLILILALLIGYFVYDNIYVPAEDTIVDLREQQVAVRFQDFAQITDRLEIPAMASHWIGNRLREIPGAHVVNYEDALSEPDILIALAGVEKRREFAERTHAVTVLEGTIYRQSDKLLFEAHIYDLESGESLQAFEVVECDVNNPMKGIRDLGSRILGWWATKDDLVYSIPNYEAYQLYLEARSVWREDEKTAESKLKASILTDSTFIDPYFLIMQLYLNNLDYEHGDSLLNLINTRFDDLTPRQQSLMDAYDAGANGKLLDAYVNYKAELAADPYDVFVNTAGMVEAIQYVNKPREAIHWFNMIPVESLDMKECAYCQTRLRFATIAYLRLGKIDSAIYASSILPTDSEKNARLKLKPHVTLNDTATIQRILAEYKSNTDLNSTLHMYTDLAWRFKLLGREDLVKHYAELALANINEPNEANAVTVEANYVLGNYEKVIDLIEGAWPLSKYGDNEYVLIWTSRAYAQAGSQEDRLDVSQHIQSAIGNSDYGYGRDAYMLAVMATIQGDETRALSLLQKAYNSGNKFNEFKYQNDIDLIPLFDYPEFIQLINPPNE